MALAWGKWIIAFYFETKSVLHTIILLFHYFPLISALCVMTIRSRNLISISKEICWCMVGTICMYLVFCRYILRKSFRAFKKWWMGFFSWRKLFIAPIPTWLRYSTRCAEKKYLCINATLMLEKMVGISSGQKKKKSE